MATGTEQYRVKFGIANIGGLMNVANDYDGVPTADRYVFCHPSYTITTSLKRQDDNDYGVLHSESQSEVEGKYYTRKFRKTVRWDFGDGTTVDAQHATHSYTKPGRYKITCTFFDIHRHGYQNQYSIYVVAKEVIPTELSIDEKNYSSAVKCSKVTQIQRLSATLSLNCPNLLDVIPSRHFITDEEKLSETDYFDKDPSTYSYMDRYWCFIENTASYRYRGGSDLINDNLKPVQKYSPYYDFLYGTFEYDKSLPEGKQIYFSFWWVNPYKEVNERLKSISYINPNFDFMSNEPAEPERIWTQVKQGYVASDIPDSCTYVGARAFVDVYYKSDYPKANCSIFFNFDFDGQQSQPELLSSRNFTNIPPVGISIAIVKNNLADVSWIATSDGFAHFDISKERSKHIDDYLAHSIIRGEKRPTYIIPAIRYETTYTDGTIENELLQKSINYYIPKDIYIDNYSLTCDSGSSFINEILIDGYDHILSHTKAYMIETWDDEITLTWKVNDMVMFTETISTINTGEITVPLVNQHKEDFERLIAAYMPHRMFAEADNLKDLFRAVFKNNGAFDYLNTYSQNFFDNIVNYKTNFLSNLVSTLYSMGQDVPLYSSSNFEGVNGLRDFVRLLSINHTNLVGHAVDDKYDIKVKSDYRGINVGDQLYSSDLVSVDENGILRGITRDGVERGILKDLDLTQLIVHDKYTDETWLVNIECIKGKSVCFGEYTDEWGWGLLLPDRFNIVKPMEDKQQIVDSYYQFFLLNPKTKQTRSGNFIDERYITPEIESYEEWSSEWGIAYKCLLKILSIHIGNVNDDDYTLANDKSIEEMPVDIGQNPIVTTSDQYKEMLDQTNIDIDSGELEDVFHPFKKKHRIYVNKINVKEKDL